MKSKKRIPLYLLSLLFYGSILFLTLYAWDIRCARLPQVTAGRLKKQEFTYTGTLQNGQTFETTYKFFGIPKELIAHGRIFEIETIQKENLTYYYAKEIYIPIDMTKENETSYALIQTNFNKTIILTGYETLEDGMEVHIIKEDEKNPH